MSAVTCVCHTVTTNPTWSVFVSEVPPLPQPESPWRSSAAARCSMVIARDTTAMKTKRKLRDPPTEAETLSSVKHVTVETSNNTEDSSEVDSIHSDSDSEAVDNVADDSPAGDASDSDAADSDSDNEDAMLKNEGWADSVAKILGSNKPKNKKTLVLSRAKKYSEVVVKKETPSFDVVGDEKEEKPKDIVIKADPDTAKKRKIDHVSVRVKPNILEKDRERSLAKIATKGVVQLFNAVKNQQNSLKKEIDTVGQSEGKREKVLKKFDKRTFLDTLMGQTKSTIVDDNSKTKDEVKDEDKPKWNALRDDFMMGAKMKDWDRETLED